ncbi:MAG TPA: glycosyltransferase family 2 protein [Candidatus Saccharimonadales bacterium]|nr:glycosyltransferase family 2 protein [Candidatus Saccharimonadales bacterium]
MKLSIVVPVYNEKNTIREILSRIKNVRDIDKEIILVDDGSTDGTRDILKQIQQEQPDVKVLFKDYNSGKGDSLKIGFQHSTGDYVIVQDADLEYDPNDYHILLNALSEKHAQVVYGSRFSGNYKDMSSLHFVGNKILTFATNLLFGVTLTDMETCYKLVPGDFIRKISIKSKRFNFEPEITAKILKSKLKMVEVPINYKGRSHSEGKKITWKDGISALSTLIRYRYFD